MSAPPFPVSSTCLEIQRERGGGSDAIKKKKKNVNLENSFSAIFLECALCVGHFLGMSQICENGGAVFI